MDNFTFQQFLSYITKRKKFLKDAICNEPAISSFCCSSKSLAVNKNEEKEANKRELEYLETRKPLETLFNYIISFFENKYNYVKIKSFKNKLIFSFEGMNVFEIIFSKHNVSFRLLESFMGIDIDKISSYNPRVIEDKNLFIKSFNKENSSYLATLNNTRYTLGTKVFSLGYATISIIEKFIDYVYENLVPIFLTSYSFKNKKTGNVDFFVSITDEDIYLIHFENRMIYSSKKVSRVKKEIRSFSKIKDSFIKIIPGFKKINSRDYVLIKREVWSFSFFIYLNLYTISNTFKILLWK